MAGKPCDVCPSPGLTIAADVGELNGGGAAPVLGPVYGGGAAPVLGPGAGSGDGNSSGRPVGVAACSGFLCLFFGVGTGKPPTICTPSSAAAACAGASTGCVGGMLTAGAAPKPSLPALDICAVNAGSLGAATAAVGGGAGVGNVNGMEAVAGGGAGVGNVNGMEAVAGGAAASWFGSSLTLVPYISFPFLSISNCTPYFPAASIPSITMPLHHISA